jgi:DNA-directed RNA polymerase specialized sigma24 family protein
MSASAIGEYLGISEPAAKMQIFRAKKRLSRIFNEMQENPLLYLALVGGER